MNFHFGVNCPLNAAERRMNKTFDFLLVDFRHKMTQQTQIKVHIMCFGNIV